MTTPSFVREYLAYIFLSFQIDALRNNDNGILRFAILFDGTV